MAEHQSDSIRAEGLFNSVFLPFRGLCCWGEAVECRMPGVYVVEAPAEVLDANTRGLRAACSTVPLDLERVRAWINRVPKVQLADGRRSADGLAERLRRYWWGETRVLYIGMTTDPLRTRIGAMFRHQLGENGPHRGGHWLHALSEEFLRRTTVSWAPVVSERAKRTEDEMLWEFIDRLIAQDPMRSRESPGELLPFANLLAPPPEPGRTTPRGSRRKRHGIKYSTR